MNVADRWHSSQSNARVAGEGWRCGADADRLKTPDNIDHCTCFAEEAAAFTYGRRSGATDYCGTKTRSE